MTFGPNFYMQTAAEAALLNYFLLEALTRLRLIMKKDSPVIQNALRSLYAIRLQTATANNNNNNNSPSNSYASVAS